MMLGRVGMVVVLLSGGVVMAQNNPCQTTEPISILGSASATRATIVYDPNQSVCWLANANLAADPAMQSKLSVIGVTPNGAMDYATALKWVAALNADGNSGYLGHNNWQLPVAPLVDHACFDIGTFGGSFGPLCSSSALSNLYSAGLKQTFPASVAPGLAAAAGPIRNLKASYYWAAQNNGGTSGTSNGGQETFSFANGIQGGTTINDTYFYVLPMIAGAIGTAPPCPAGAGVVPYTSSALGGNAAYDCVTRNTWLSDANLAASTSFGITGNLTIANNTRSIAAPKIDGGAMLYSTAVEWVQAMNSSQYLGSSAWQIPATSKVLQDLFNDLSLVQGDSRLLWSGSLGPFQNLQPFFYWACQRDASGSSQSPCTDYAPADGASQLQWSFNFDSGFQSTSSLVQKFFVEVYYPVSATTMPVVSLIANAEGESLTIAPNTWVEVKGANLAPAGDTRIWQTSDFTNNEMPAQLDGVSVTVNGKMAYVYYISPAQINFLTPPDALPAYPQVVVTNNTTAAGPFVALGQAISPSFFVLEDGQQVVAVHLDGSLVGSVSLSAPGYPFTPAKPGETIVIYANGFGPTSISVSGGSVTQGGTLSPLPVVTIGGKNATVQFAGLISPGLFQFNVVVPDNASTGDLAIKAIGGGATTQPGTVLTVHP